MAVTQQEKQPFGGLSGPHLLVVYLAGLVTIYVGERLLGGNGASRFVTSAVGAGLTAIAWGAWTAAWLRSSGAARAVERMFAALSFAGLVALALYVLGSDIVHGPESVVRSKAESIGLREIVSVAWPIVLLCSTLPLIFLQWSAASMARGKGIESFRAAASARAGATTASLLSTLFLVNAIANRKDAHADLSYFKVAEPSESARDLVAASEEETEALLFFPEVSEVLEAVRPYFDALAKTSDRFKVTVVDPIAAPEAARKHRVTEDGTVVIARGESSEKLKLGDDMKDARRRIRQLDADLQKVLLKLTVERKTVYVVSGHGERASKKRDDDTRSPLGMVSKILESSNLTVKSLGPVEGLATSVPEDAAVVIWTDPLLPPFPGETEALKIYLERGGRLLLTLDTTSESDLGELLSFLGLSFSKTTLANDKSYIPLRRDPTDKHNLVTASFSSHPSVGSFSSKQALVPVLFPVTGSLKKAPGAEKKVTFTVRAPSGTWADEDGDATRGGDEKPGSFNLAAAVSMKTKKKKGEKEDGTNESLSDEMRAVVFSDTDLFSDEYIGFRIGYSGRPGNLQLLADALEWLVGQAQVAEVADSEEDVRIAHTRDEDVFWFYITIFAVPLLILGIGVITRWGRGRKRRAG
jgi:ABC-type uncharacterized transport system involved in gliding motility auxiliary subunit